MFNKRKKKMNKETWATLNIKDKLAIMSACIAFLLGWALSIASFIVPPLGIISDGVLWVLGQALLYAASVFGVASYFNSETIRLRKDIKRQLHHYKEIEEEEEEKDEG